MKWSRKATAITVLALSPISFASTFLFSWLDLRSGIVFGPFGFIGFGIAGIVLFHRAFPQPPPPPPPDRWESVVAIPPDEAGYFAHTWLEQVEKSKARMVKLTWRPLLVSPTEARRLIRGMLDSAESGRPYQLTIIRNIESQKPKK